MLKPKPTRRQALKLGASTLATAIGMQTSSAPVLASPVKASGRQTTSFDDGWLFTSGPCDGGERIDADDRLWRAVELPHDWSIEDRPGASVNSAATKSPNLIDGDQAARTAPGVIGPFDRASSAGGKKTGWTVGGEGWYRKRFVHPGVAAHQRFELRFDGVMGKTDVWLNGRHIAFHAFGYTPFSIDISEWLQAGENVLALRVRNLGSNSRWYTGSGVYRHTWLVRTDTVHLPEHAISITTPSVGAEGATVVVSTEVRNLRTTSSVIRVRTTLLDKEGRRCAHHESSACRIEASELSEFKATVWIPRPELWSPASPSLYRCHTEVLMDGSVTDGVWTSFGIRTIEFDAQGFRLNGVTTKLRGTNIHHDHGPLGAISLDRSEERRIEILKAAGFNAVRLAHNPHNPRLLDICDRLGMLVYSEIFDMWDRPKADIDEGYHTEFPNSWENDLRTWVLTERNHPSLILRSIGNEINGSSRPDAQQIANRGAQLASVVRAIDPSRPVCMGGGQSITSFQRFAKNDAFVDVLDVHYDRSPERIQRSSPNKALLCSESYIESMDTAWALVEKYPWHIGDFSWTGWDYIGEAAIGHPLTASVTPAPGLLRDSIGSLTIFGIHGYPWFAAWCGDHDMIGRVRPQMRYRQVIWGERDLELMVERPLPGWRRLSAAAWSWYDEMPSWTWDVPEGTLLTVRVYTRGDRVQLLRNGQLIGDERVKSTDRSIVEFKVQYRRGELSAVASRGKQELGRKTLVTVGAPHGIRIRSDVPELSQNRDDLAHLMLEVVDAQGRLVPDAVRYLNLSVVDGELLGFGNGSPYNVDSFQRPQKWTFHGGALAIVRAARPGRSILIRVSSAGLQEATLTLPVRAG